MRVKLFWTGNIDLQSFRGRYRSQGREGYEILAPLYVMSGVACEMSVPGFCLNLNWKPAQSGGACFNNVDGGAVCFLPLKCNKRGYTVLN